MRGRSWVWYFVALCLVVFVITHPEQSAGIVSGAVDGAITLVTNVIEGLSRAG